MNAVAIFVTIIVLFIPILADRPAKRPGNLTPIQLISALGAWALVFANASAAAIGIRDGSPLLVCTAAVVTLSTLVLMLRQNAVRVPEEETPDSLKRVIDDLKQLLGGAPRLGVASLEAVVVDGSAPGISVVVVRWGRVIVRIRRDVAEWLERHRRAGGAGADLVASFARFIVLHELAHALNGDHRTFRFVRSVLVSQFAWVVAGAAATAFLIVDPVDSARPMVVAASIIVLSIIQSLVARRFVSERERLADWRALQTLSPDDTARLLDRRGRRRAIANPTALEKLMTDLKVNAATVGGGWMSRFIGIVWPEGDDIRLRSDRMAGDRAGDGARPILWAALTGMQCGFLAMSLAVAAMLAGAPWMPLQGGASVTLLLAITTWVGAPAVTFCALRVDPARMSVRMPRVTSRRIVVGVVFYLAFAASALGLSRFHTRFGLVSMPSAPFFAVILIALGMMVAVCIWVSIMAGTHQGGGGELLTAPRSSWIRTFPLIAGLLLILAPLSVIASDRLGMGSLLSGAWVPMALLSFAGYVASTGMARSTSPILRRVAPMALLDTPEPVYGFRMFWRDFYIDLSHTTLIRAAAVVMAMQLVAIPFFFVGAVLFVWTMSDLVGARATFVVTFLTGIAVMALILVIPDRYRAYRGPSARLLDTSRLQLLERLLAAARIADPAAAGRLNASLVQWLRNDRFPNALLPATEAVWPLAPLLILVRLARETGEHAALDRWRDRIERALRQVVSDDAVTVAPRQPPSMHWTVLAAALIEEAELRDLLPLEPMLDRIEVLLDDRLRCGTANLLADLMAAWRLLRRHGRPGPDPERVREFLRSSLLVSRPALRQSLEELADLAKLAGDTDLRERLGPMIRSRSWEGLQLNPRKDVLLLLDCYLAAVSLGELDARHAAAGVLIAELADRVATELSAVVSEASLPVSTRKRRTTA